MSEKLPPDPPLELRAVELPATTLRAFAVYFGAALWAAYIWHADASRYYLALPLMVFLGMAAVHLMSWSMARRRIALGIHLPSGFNPGRPVVDVEIVYRAKKSAKIDRLVAALVVCDAQIFENGDETNGGHEKYVLERNRLVRHEDTIMEPGREKTVRFSFPTNLAVEKRPEEIAWFLEVELHLDGRRVLAERYLLD